MKRISTAVSMALVLIVTGCSANANSGKSSDKESSTGSGDGKLIAAYSEGGTTLSPAEANDVTSDTFVVAAYDQLVTYGRTTEDGKPKAKTDEIKPMLAKSWDVSQDKTKYTFTLRKDVTFHDGSKLTSDDVVDSFKYIEKSASGSFLYNMAGITQVTAKSPYKVEIDLKRPNHLFMQMLPMYTFSIVNMDKVNKNGGAKWLRNHTAGSGPYKVKKWQPSTEAVLKRNNEYWGKEPSLKKVVMKFIGEPSNRAELLRSGSVDLALEIAPKDVKALGQAPGVTIDSRKSNKVLFFGMNNKVKPFDDPKVRQAISYAIPTKKLITNVMKGQASPMTSSVPSNMPGFCNTGYKYSYNLDKAKKLLAKAGYPNGFSFDFTLGAGFPDWADDAVLIQSSLEKIGVKMNIHKMARSPFLDALAAHKLDTWITRWTSFVNDPGYHLGLLLKSGAGSNHSNFSNKKVDALLEQAATTDSQEGRNKLYCQAQQIITKKAPWAYLYEYNIVLALRDEVKGYTSYPDGIVRFFQMSNG